MSSLFPAGFHANCTSCGQQRVAKNMVNGLCASCYWATGTMAARSHRAWYRFHQFGSVAPYWANPFSNPQYFN